MMQTIPGTVDLNMMAVILETRKVTMERAIERYQETLAAYNELRESEAQNGQEN
jgi:hypothetical protein